MTIFVCQLFGEFYGISTPLLLFLAADLVVGQYQPSQNWVNITTNTSLVMNPGLVVNDHLFIQHIQTSWVMNTTLVLSDQGSQHNPSNICSFGVNGRYGGPLTFACGPRWSSGCSASTLASTVWKAAKLRFDMHMFRLGCIHSIYIVYV